MIGVIIQARMGSVRLPGKSLALIEGQPMIQHVIERVQLVKTVDRVILATTCLTEDDRLAELASSIVPVYRGHPFDVLDRYYQCAKNWGLDPIVRITGDCPLIDPQMIDACTDAFRPLLPAAACDYLSNAYPTASFPDGLDVEIFSFAALEHAWRKARLKSEREHVTPYIWKRPETFALHSVMCDRDLSRYRWCVDEPADLEFVRAIYQRMGRELFGWREVLALVEREPELGAINDGPERNKAYWSMVGEEVHRDHD